MSYLKCESSIILHNYYQPLVLLQRIDFSKKSINKSSKDVYLTLRTSKLDIQQHDVNDNNNLELKNDGDYKISNQPLLDLWDNDEKCYRCKECKFASKYKGSLKTHIMKHLGQKRYKCAQCNFASLYFLSLKNHIKSYHTKEHPYKCLNCEYTCVSASSLTYHFKRVHEKVRPFKCAHCTYATIQLAFLKVHIETVHLKKRPYKCQFCQYASGLLTNTKKHIENIHTKE